MSNLSYQDFTFVLEALDRVDTPRAEKIRKKLHSSYFLNFDKSFLIS